MIGTQDDDLAIIFYAHRNSVLESMTHHLILTRNYDLQSVKASDDCHTQEHIDLQSVKHLIVIWECEQESVHLIVM